MCGLDSSKQVIETSFQISMDDLLDYILNKFQVVDQISEGNINKEIKDGKQIIDNFDHRKIKDKRYLIKFCVYNNIN